MAQAFMARKIKSSTKLRCAQSSPERSAKSTNFSVPETQIIPAQSACGKETLIFASLLVSMRVVPVKNDYFLNLKFERLSLLVQRKKVWYIY